MFLALPALVVAGLLQASTALAGNGLTVPMKETARTALQRCLGRMHHDTDEFVECIDAMAAPHRAQPAVNLAVRYVGLVGCVSAARIGTLHSDVCSQTYLLQTDRLRQRLGLSDTELCPLAPGDCRSRVAQLDALRRMPVPRPQRSQAAEGDGHRHRH